MSLIKNVLDSFHNQPEGFSARKLSAFAGVCTSVYISVINATPTNVNDLVWAWNIFIWFCLGLITASQLIAIRTGSTTTIEKKEEKTVVKNE